MNNYNIAPGLGVLRGSFRVKLDFRYFLPHAALTLVALLGFAIWWGSNAGWQRYVSLFVFALLTTPLVFAIWKTLPHVFDRLSVYENGFVYERGRTRLSIVAGMRSRTSARLSILKCPR